MDLVKGQQATMGFVQVWLDVATIIIISFIGFCSGRNNIAEHLFLLFIFIKSQAAVTGGRNSNATPAQSPVVACNAQINLNCKMKFKLLIFLLTVSSLTFGQFKISKIDSTKLPIGFKFSGHITNSAKWKDSFGVHYVLTTESGEYFSKDKENNEFKNAELFVYHYISNSDSLKLVWKIYDHNKNCEFDVFTKFIDNAFKVTDLDKNGIVEVWVMYENQCTSDVSPAPTKIIMYEGNKKYAIRGENRVKVSDKDFIGGQFTLDENFKTGNTLFRQFGINLWKKNIRKK